MKLRSHLTEILLHFTNGPTPSAAPQVWAHARGHRYASPSPGAPIASAICPATPDLAVGRQMRGSSTPQPVEGVGLFMRRRILSVSCEHVFIHVVHQMRGSSTPRQPAGGAVPSPPRSCWASRAGRARHCPSPSRCIFIMIRTAAVTENPLRLYSAFEVHIHQDKNRSGD
jgi:hypothetical protein